MDILYIPQLDGVGGGGAGPGSGYRLLAGEAEDGRVALADRALTKIVSDGSDLELVIPPRRSGYLRDFFVRIVTPVAALPAIAFVTTDGDGVDFEGPEPEVTDHVATIFLTEVDEGVFIAKSVTSQIEATVTFDANGGVSEESRRIVPVGSPLGYLPCADLEGREFAGWFDAREGGTMYSEESVVGGALTLYARWADPEGGGA